MPFGPQGFDFWEFLRGVRALRSLLRRPAPPAGGRVEDEGPGREKLRRDAEDRRSEG